MLPARSSRSTVAASSGGRESRSTSTSRAPGCEVEQPGQRPAGGQHRHQPAGQLGVVGQPLVERRGRARAAARWPRATRPGPRTDRSRCRGRRRTPDLAARPQRRWVTCDRVARTTGAMARLRVGPGPAQPGGRRSRRQHRADHRGHEDGRGRRLRPGRLPGAGHHRLSARGPPAQAGVRGRQPRRARPDGGRQRALRGGGRLRRPATATTSSTRRPSAPTGSVVGIYHKQLLPNYEVFDERRYFEPGTGPVELYLIGGRAGGGDDLRGRLVRRRPAGRRPAGPAPS